MKKRVLPRRLHALVRRSVWLPLGKYILITYDPFYHRKTWQTLIGIEKMKGENSTDIWLRCYKVAIAFCVPNKEISSRSAARSAALGGSN